VKNNLAKAALGESEEYHPFLIKVALAVLASQKDKPFLKPFGAIPFAVDYCRLPLGNRNLLINIVISSRMDSS
jgi:hypothetical protein